MKLAISTRSPERNSPLDPRFGRACFFWIVDSETGDETVLDNSEGVNAAQGAGIHAAQALARLGVGAVLTGHVGPKAWTALQAANIQVYPVKGGSVDEAIQSFLGGELRPIRQPQVQGHW